MFYSTGVRGAGFVAISGGGGAPVPPLVKKSPDPCVCISCFVSRVLCLVIGGGGGRGNRHLATGPSGVRGTCHTQPLTGQAGVPPALCNCQHTPLPSPGPRDCIIARPVCPSNENKCVYSFILFILPFWPRLGCFSMFFLCFFVFFGCFPEVYVFSICCCPSLHPFFSPKVYVLPCLQHILSRRVSMRCKHHGIEIRNNGIGVHI